MKDFSLVKVRYDKTGQLQITNPDNLRLIGKGRQGVILSLSDNKCVKIYAKEEDAKIEYMAYQKAQDSRVVPKLYEVGKNYIIMEYVNGKSLIQHIKQHGDICEKIAEELVYMYREMQRIGFIRMDVSLRHILINEKLEIKLVDIYYAYKLNDVKPVKFFKQLSDLHVLNGFLEKVKFIDLKLYNEWSKMLPVYFKVK